MADVAPVLEDARANLLRRWWAVSGLALFAATWKLWVPPTEFPQVPLFGWAGTLPPFVDRLTFGVLLGSLATAAWKPDSRRGWLTFAAALGVLMALDQHRLQPWAWQLLLMAIWWGSAAVGQIGNLPHAALTVSIYFWSAVSKLDADFFVSHGPTLVESLLGAVGIDAAPWSPRWKWWLAVCLPLGELLVAIGLCGRRTRRVALFGATALHLGLILALGPLGLGHSAGVLTWNVAFIGHVWLLFGRRTHVPPTVTRSVSEGGPTHDSIERSDAACARSPSLALRVGLLGFVCVWPITERWGLCDRWLAWSVYVARSERVSVTLTDDGLRCLPESVRRCVAEGELPLDRWSLAALDVPIYPQLRFQFGVVEWLRLHCGEEALVEVIVQHSDGRRGEVERLTVEQLGARRQEFWINMQPRRSGTP